MKISSVGAELRQADEGTDGRTEIHNEVNGRFSGFEDRLCGLVVRVSGYRYRGPGFDSRRYHIF
jgi:hypothetical protein